MSEAEMNTALENIPNVGVVIVTFIPIVSSRRTKTWNIELVTEIGDDPALQVLSNALLLDSPGNDLNPTVEVTPVTSRMNTPRQRLLRRRSLCFRRCRGWSDSSFSFNLVGSPSSPLLSCRAEIQNGTSWTYAKLIGKSTRRLSENFSIRR